MEDKYSMSTPFEKYYRDNIYHIWKIQKLHFKIDKIDFFMNFE